MTADAMVGIKSLEGTNWEERSWHYAEEYIIHMTEQRSLGEKCCKKDLLTVWIRHGYGI